MGKARATTKRRISAPPVGGVDANITPPPTYDAATGANATIAVPAGTNVPGGAVASMPTAVHIVPTVVNNVPVKKEEERPMETDSNDSHAPSSGDAVMNATNLVTPTKPTVHVEVVNTPVSSGSSLNVSRDSAIKSGTGADTTGGTRDGFETETDSFDSIPGMFASVSMISDKVRADYPVTARPPTVVTMGMVSVAVLLVLVFGLKLILGQRTLGEGT